MSKERGRPNPRLAWLALRTVGTPPVGTATLDGGTASSSAGGAGGRRGSSGSKSGGGGGGSPSASDVVSTGAVQNLHEGLRDFLLHSSTSFAVTNARSVYLVLIGQSAMSPVAALRALLTGRPARQSRRRGATGSAARRAPAPATATPPPRPSPR